MRCNSARLQRALRHPALAHTVSFGGSLGGGYFSAEAVEARPYRASPGAQDHRNGAQSQSFRRECHVPDAADPDLISETLLTTFSHQCTQYRALRWVLCAIAVSAIWRPSVASKALEVKGSQSRCLFGLWLSREAITGAHPDFPGHFRKIRHTGKDASLKASSSEPLQDAPPKHSSHPPFP